MIDAGNMSIHLKRGLIPYIIRSYWCLALSGILLASADARRDQCTEQATAASRGLYDTRKILKNLYGDAFNVNTSGSGGVVVLGQHNCKCLHSLLLYLVHDLSCLLFSSR